MEQAAVVHKMVLFDKADLRRIRYLVPGLKRKFLIHNLLGRFSGIFQRTYGNTD